MNNDDKKKEMMGFVHGKASLRSLTAMGIASLLIKEKLNKVRSENEDDSFSSHNFSDDFIRAMHNQYRT